MMKAVEDAEAWMDNLVEQCEIANESYLHELQRFVRKLILEQQERERDEKKTDLGLEMVFRKAMGRSIKRQKEKFRALAKPRPMLIPGSLDAIYAVLKQIFSKKGWPTT